MIEQRIADVVARHTRDIADFPSPGVVFKDLTPLFADPAAFGQVLDLLGRGHADKEIAAALGTSAKTARYHVANLLAKLGAHNRTDAVRLAFERGLLEL